MVSGATVTEPRRLSGETHELAARALSGEHGRGMEPADWELAPGPECEAECVRYARAVRSIAQRAPLRVLPGELIVGSATLLEARRHQTPVIGSRSTSHTTPGFARALKWGYRELRRQIDERLATDGLREDRRRYLQSMRICLDAAGLWHRRHVELLEERIAESEGERRRRYERVLSGLRNVPENPPGSFREAVQSLWFMFCFQRLCGNWPGVGRIDEMLGPYLRDDLERGRITLDEARELLAHFWVHGCEWIDGCQNAGSGDAQTYQNIILSGVDAEGKDVTNEVTYLVLDVVEELLISDFPIAVRISKRTPERLLRRIAEVQRRGGGIVAVYNEEVVIETLERFGYPLEEARGFANDGCWEVLIPGRTSFGYCPFDSLALLQEVIGTAGADAAAPDFADFESLYAAFRVRLARHLDELNGRLDAQDTEGAGGAPLLSLLVEDCIARGRDYHDRGPRYTVWAPHAGGLPDAANELLVIKKLVYDEGVLSLAELTDILRANWEGHEPLRRRVRERFRLFGNDDEAADAMVRRLYDDYTELVARVPERAGVLRPAGLSTFGRQIGWAAHRAATATGFRRGEYLSNNFSPCPGTDRAGPTAVLKSFCCVDFRKLPNGTALDLKVHPSGLRGEAGVVALVSLLKTFVELGGWFMHVDVVDSAALRAAQADPDRYANLAVRISGWSARFVTLDKEWQEMVIRRTEQEFR